MEKRNFIRITLGEGKLLRSEIEILPQSGETQGKRNGPGPEISETFADHDSFEALPRIRLSPNEAVLPRAMVPRRSGRRLHRHHHHGRCDSLRQIQKLQIQR